MSVASVRPSRGRVASALLLLIPALGACGGDSSGPDLTGRLRFGTATIDLGQTRSGTAVLRNVGESALGPISIVAGPVMKDGAEVAGVSVFADPASVASLAPGDTVTIRLGVDSPQELEGGTYTATVAARVSSRTAATAGVTFAVPYPPAAIGSVALTGPTALRQGDVARFQVEVRDTAGAVITGAPIDWGTVPAGAGYFAQDGRFAPYTPGAISLVARVGDVADTLPAQVSARGVASTFSIVGGSNLTDRWTSDIWVNGDVAYTGTWGFRKAQGNTLYVWDVSGNTPRLRDSVRVDASTINDVKVSEDGSFIVITHERPSTASLAISILDASDPLRPRVVGSYTADMSTTSWPGVHNAWIDGNYVYIVVDGSAPDRGMWVIDVSDRANPRRVAKYWGGTGCVGSCFLHDVYVRDGLAFLSHWDAGLQILDVGNGVAGGSPTNPVEVGRVVTQGGQVHNAWYWPAAKYVFVGEEDFATPGEMHVVDVSDMEQPVEVASFSVPGDTPHNFWLDEDRGILYMAWYTQGLVALDVSGELLGRLDQQGRLIARRAYDGETSCPNFDPTGTCTWAPQLVNGRVIVSDMNSGVWILQPNF